MAYVVKTVTTKPAGKQWFGQANPTASRQFIAWSKAQPGVLSAIGRVSAPNTYETITVFADQAAYEAYQAAAAENADAKARTDYATAQGFQITVSIVG